MKEAAAKMRAEINRKRAEALKRLSRKRKKIAAIAAERRHREGGWRTIRTGMVGADPMVNEPVRLENRFGLLDVEVESNGEGEHDFAYFVLLKQVTLLRCSK